MKESQKRNLEIKLKFAIYVAFSKAEEFGFYNNIKRNYSLEEMYKICMHEYEEEKKNVFFFIDEILKNIKVKKNVRTRKSRK